MTKLWGGRFAGEGDPQVHAFNASIAFDRRLAHQDVAGSRAWARALGRAGILTADEVTQIRQGLRQIAEEFRAESFVFAATDEDIHTAVERRLVEIVGPVGGKLHTGRSRNDQVATDFRLWLMSAIDVLDGQVRSLQAALLARARQHLRAPMPGYTHMQPAQPVTWGHWALSHFWPLERDRRRLAAARSSSAVLPLGSGALAGTGFPIDRTALAADLGFAAVASNSMDAVSDRDFAADFLFAAALLGVHLSRLAEQLILFAGPGFGFVRIDDADCTGSSLMPQKRNPDTLELTRGKCGRLVGHLTALLVTLKGLPSTYDKDLQEDKEAVFDAYDTLAGALPVMAGLIGALEVYPEAMRAALDPGLLATDLADYLVGKGVPFREAHGLVGRAVRLAEESGRPLPSLRLEELRDISEAFGPDVTAVFDWETALERRAAIGGTAIAALEAQWREAVRALEGLAG